MSKSIFGRACLAAVLSVATFAAAAQAYPSRPITLIVPYTAGGPTDVAGRIMAQGLGDRLGQRIVVSNVAGAGGIVGTDQASRAQPDGYTLYFAVNSMAIFPHTRAANDPLPFDPLAFVPVGGVAQSAHVVVAGRDAGFRTIPEMVAAAKKNPGKVSFGSAGVGGTTHLPLALFAHEANIDLLHVPYRGAAQAMLDVIAGQVAMAAPGYSGAITDSVRTGTLVPMAVTSADRLPFLPEVPTLAELGYPSMVFPIWYALFAPKGTPPEIVNRLTVELRALADESEHQEKLKTQGNVPWNATPEQLGKVLADGIQSLGDRLKASGINLAN